MDDERFLLQHRQYHEQQRTRWVLRIVQLVSLVAAIVIIWLILAHTNGS